jgi:hypothetical protein
MLLLRALMKRGNSSGARILPMFLLNPSLKRGDEGGDWRGVRISAMFPSTSHVQYVGSFAVGRFGRVYNGYRSFEPVAWEWHFVRNVARGQTERQRQGAVTAND